ncbi:TonB-dependent receptor [Niveispirillum sp. BGYR6]|uniref:TonB-dependent receptor n=1 Tax=Niveispirillum sp. BGYR6 TaxID=2971249 RepID=UPI0022B9BC80|nr:TonB-dependent receptor [Niveispirillum sp. BGYR6]MDG5497804.1 TonB-dependent receptor [Niveispirillum sp. BGYR6]
MAFPRPLSRSLLLATALSSLAVPALAQNGGPMLDEIIVTAQRRETALQTTPVAISALTADALADQQIGSAEDLTSVVPNLVLMPVTASRSTLQVGLRGGSEQSGGLVTSESAVAFYADDVYRGRLAGSNLELADIERIEVLRGPQGTLYGRNAFSGAVKIVTRTPGEKRWAEAAVGVGSYDQRKASASIGGDVVEGALGASLSVLYNDQDGYVHNQALDRDVFGQRNLALRGKLHFHGSDWLKATLTVSRTQDDNDGPANLIPVGWARTYPTKAANHVTTDDARPLAGDAYTTLSPVVPDGYTDQTAVSLDVSAELGDMTLRSITAFVRTDDGFLFDMSGGIRNADGSYRANGLVRDANSDTNQYSQELQLQGDGFGGDLTWITGLYYFREENKQTFKDVLVLGPGFSLPVLPQTIDSTTNSYAAFAQASYQLTERLSVTGGLRYTRDEKELKGTIQNRLPLSPGPAVALVSLYRDPSFESWTPKAGLDFKIADDVFSYLSVSRGFKAGGFNGLAVANPAVFGTVYGPQTVWAYEAGLKATMLEGRLRTNLSVYRNDLSDLQQTIEIAPSSYAVQNIGDSRVYGAELEVTFMPVEGLNLFANLGLMDDKYTHLDPLSDAAVAGARHLPLLTPWTVQTGFTYDTPRFWQDRVKLRLSSSYQHQGDYYSTVANLLESKMPGLINASIALLDGEEGWNITFAGKNLSNKTYFTTAPTNAAIAVAEPRTWSLTAGYKF